MVKLKVMLATEGTYPFHQGGVSTWCDILLKRLKDVEYVIYSVMMNPFVTQKFQLPHSTSLLRMPLWGTEEPSEHLSTPFSSAFLSKKRTDDHVVNSLFLPLLSRLLEGIVNPVVDSEQFGQTLLDLNMYFQEYEYKESFKSEATWGFYKDTVQRVCTDRYYRIAQPDLYGMIQSLGWVYRFMNILNTPIPKVHVTHASAAAFCGIPCVLAKLRDQTPYMLTEHGVYIREQYLSLSKRGYSPFMGTFLIRFIQSVTGLNYTYADQVSPVCDYNTRWETRLGVPEKRIQVIYNGVDQNIFTEGAKAPQPNPTVVMVARVDPVKDMLTFIKSADLVLKQIPEAKFIVYGSVAVPSYYEECLALCDELKLKERFVFAGHTSQMSAAYQSGDVIVLSSISEAFPYSVVEAMMTGKPVIATDVGGVSEALGDTGILVPPLQPDRLAEGIVRFLQEPELRYEMGREGRQRALDYFTLDKVLEIHLKSYIRLAVKARQRPQVEERSWIYGQRLHMDKGYAFCSIGMYEEAIAEFKSAIKLKPGSPLTPVALAEIAGLYNRMGQYDRAFQELQKCEAYIEWSEAMFASA